MKSSLAFLFVVTQFLAVVDADIVTKTCQNAAQGDKNIHYGFCVATLGKNPKSHSASLQGLGFISFNLTKTYATKIGSQIDKLLNGGRFSLDVKARLEDCKTHYSDAKSKINEAVTAFKSKDYSSANIKMSSVLDASSNCEDGFKEKPGLKSPLSVEDAAFEQLSAIALSITNLLLRGTSLV